MLRDELRRRIDAQTISDEAMGRYAAQVAAHERDPYSLIAELAAQAGAQAAGQSAASSATSTAKSCAGQSAEHSAESGASPLAPGKDDTPC
jgi:hypothetical protein